MAKEFYSQCVPEHPIREALKHLTHKSPPSYVRGYDFKNLTDSQADELQGWVGMNTPNSIFWSTAIGIIEAAEHLVKEAVANANIPPQGSEWHEETRAKKKRAAKSKKRKRA